MPELVESLLELPQGAHCVGFHVGSDEGADQAAAFLAGAPEGQAASFWVADEAERRLYADRVAMVSPEHVGCVAVLAHEQVEPSEGHLRPAPEVASFVAGHPEGVSGAADTIDRYWTAPTRSAHLEYEEWFEAQRRDWSRFLCPYDLRRVPPGEAPEILRELGRHHSHVVLSHSSQPAVKLLQLFVFGQARTLPSSLRPTLRAAEDEGLVQVAPQSGEFALTPDGEAVVRDWGESATVDW